MERKKLVRGRRAILTATLVAVLLAVFLVLGSHATARASSLAGATAQAGSSENNLGPLAGIPDLCARCHAPPTPDHDGPACGPCHSASSFLPRSADGGEISLALLRRDRAAVVQRVRPNLTRTQGGDIPVQRTADRCGKCHAPPTAYHYGPACGQCHSATDFLPANVARLAHPVSLVGGHAGLECATCHLPTRKVTGGCNTCHKAPTGHFTGTCSTCHGPEGWAKSAAAAGLAGPPAPHLLSAADDCLQCHAPGGPNWPAPASHKAYTLGQCQVCHQSAGKTSVTIQHQKVASLLVGRHAKLDCVQCHSKGQFKGTAQQCVACHQAKDRHAGQFGQECARCHTPNGWAEVTFDHSQAAFALVGAHSRAACTSCHAGGRFEGTPQKCVACHQAKDRHDGQFGQECGRCHTPNGWEGATFDHRQTGFELIGAHNGAACTSCHADGRYEGTPQKCVACHQAKDRHDGQFGQECGRCHTPNGWEGATFDHRQTGFELIGAHGGAACTSCHADGRYEGTPRECVACHQADDHHGGQFGQDCARCHTPNGWEGATFDHGQTGFALIGEHSSTECTRCHTDGRYEGTPRECVACHQADDHHGGQFGQDCGRCHTPNGWGEATFDHGQTDFPLTGAHVGTPCTSCHVNGQFDGTPRECVACHGEPAYHAGRLGTDCASCHQTGGWLPASYDRPHTFPMRHNGASDCRTCHPSALGDYTCYACHDRDEIAEKHIDHGIPDYSNCVACHPDGEDG